MSKLSSSNPFPSWSEFIGPYNVRHSQVRKHEGRYARKPHCTVASPPIFYEEEFDEISHSLMEFLRRPEHFGQETDEIFGPGESRLDRTLDVVFADLDFLTVEALEMLQQFLVEKFPLWRIVIHEDRGDEIVIYPEAIRLAEFPRDDHFEENFATLHTRMIEKDLKQEGPLKKRMTIATQKLKEVLALPSIDRGEFGILCAFRGFLNRHDYYTIAIYHLNDENPGIDLPEWDSTGALRFRNGRLYRYSKKNGTEWYVTLFGIPMTSTGELIYRWGYRNNKKEFSLGVIEDIVKSTLIPGE